jgi:glycosyltransferase involved in cell wall biosynthesis
MRICFVAHQATKEGAGRFMLDEIEYLRRAGHEVLAILPREGALTKTLAERRIEFRIVPTTWWTRAALKTTEPDYPASIVAARRIATELRDWRADIAYTHTIVVPTGALGAVFAGIPHVWHIHEFSYHPAAVEMAIEKPLLARFIAQTSNLVFFNSKAVAAEWDGHLGSAPNALVYNWVTPNGTGSKIDISDLTARELLADRNTFVMAMVGSLVRWKRQTDAIEATAQLLGEGLDVALVIVGPSTDAKFAAELHALIQERGLSGRVRLVGYTEHPEAILRAANVAVVCSDREPFGRVTIEAMAQGTPVVATNSGGTPEIIEDGVSGLLFPTGDSSALAAHIRTLVSNPDRLAQLGASAKERARLFQNADDVMQPVIGRLQSLVGTGNPSSPLGGFIGLGIDTCPAAPTPPQSVIGRLRSLIVRS